MHTYHSFPLSKWECRLTIYTPTQESGSEKGFEDDASIMISHPGLHLVVKDIKAPPPLAVRIQRIFAESGFEILGTMPDDPTFEPNKIEISVGQK